MSKFFGLVEWKHGAKSKESQKKHIQNIEGAIWKVSRVFFCCYNINAKTFIRNHVGFLGESISMGVRMKWQLGSNSHSRGQ